MNSPKSAARHSQRGWAWLGPAISAVAGLIAGDKARKAQNQANDRAVELANDSIQRRVADARAAGIHPIYALNASGAATPAIQAGDYRHLAEAGQDLGRAVTAAQGNNDRIQTMTEQRAWNQEQHAMTREAHQMEMELQRARLFRLQTDPSIGPAQPSGVPSTNGPFTVTPIPPAPNPASSPVGLANKSKPGFERFYAGDTPYDLPNSDLAEILEGMGVAGHVVGPMMMRDHVKARDMRERLAQYDADAAALGRPRDGYAWHYDKQRKAWREVPRGFFLDYSSPKYREGLGWDDNHYPRRKGM